MGTMYECGSIRDFRIKMKFWGAWYILAVDQEVGEVEWRAVIAWEAGVDSKMKSLQRGRYSSLSPQSKEDLLIHLVRIKLNCIAIWTCGY